MKKIIRIFLMFILLLIISPVYITLLGSFMGIREIELSIGGMFGGSGSFVSIPLLPLYPTAKPYKELMLYSETFYRMFWNSCMQTFPTVIGQAVIASTAAWAMARYSFRGKKLLFWLYVIIMLMPFQVVMVSEYLVLQKTMLLNTPWAIIIPGIFSTYPVFILTKVFETIPEEIIEASKLDGANKWDTFCRIGIPIGKGGIISVIVLGFLEYWNIIEQPLIFLKDKGKWPLSLFFPDITLNNAGSVFAASVIIMIPAVLVFILGDEYLEIGIKAIGVKG